MSSAGPDLFLPDGDAAEAASLRVDEGIRTSVERIFHGLAEHEIGLPDPDGLIGAEPIHALAVAAYFDLLGCVLRDDPTASVAAYRELAQVLSAGPMPNLAGWGNLDAKAKSILSRHVNADPSTRVALSESSPGHVEAAKAAIRAGLDLIDLCAPDMAREIGATVREIVLVSGTVNSSAGFDGATAFSLWGALVLNADEHSTRIEALDGLSHETAHAILLGRSLGRPFVLNPADELHASPLRPEPRPLDGIFHATFVSARMHYAHSRALESGLLTEHERAIAEGRLEECVMAFGAGFETLRRHARLTPLGEAHLAAASRYMDEDRSRSASAVAG